jgi:hypothetical protein
MRTAPGSSLKLKLNNSSKSSRLDVTTTWAPDPDLPDDTRLWAALQRASGGTWAGCVYDVDRIVAALDAGRERKRGARRVARRPAGRRGRRR